jgi:Peptidase A4 family
MMQSLLAQLKVLLASLATVAMSITPAAQQAIQTYTNTHASNTSAANVGSNGNSQNWAGYVATGGNYTSVSGSWTVPQPGTNGHTASDATWVGIGGVSNNDLIQSGTQNIVDPSGNITTTAFYELLPDVSTPISAVTVKSGDTVTVSISQTATNIWLINFTDNTSGQNYQTTVSYDSSLSSAEWIEEAPSNGASVLPLDNFGTVSFTGGQTTENGSSVSINGAGASSVIMVNSAGQALATPSALSSDGTNFNITRSSAVSSAPIPGFDRNPGSWRRRGRGIGQGFHFIRRFHNYNPSASESAAQPGTITPAITAEPTQETSNEVRIFRFPVRGMHFGFHR